MSVSPAEVEKYLKGANYPSKKQDLVKHAEQQNAPQDIINVLRKMPDETFNKPMDVTKAIGEIK